MSPTYISKLQSLDLGWNMFTPQSTAMVQNKQQLFPKNLSEVLHHISGQSEKSSP